MAAATGNPQFGRLLEFLEQYLQEAMRVTRGIESRRTDFMESVRAEHRAIVEAIAAKDPKAARRCALHHMTHGEQRLEAAGLLASKGAAARRGKRP
jgi:GntR family transcriptional repressor for pyruvate dehydrogenase complex